MIEIKPNHIYRCVERIITERLLAVAREKGLIK